MSCPSCSENSSTTYSRCNPPVSTNCVFYQGKDLTCPHDESFAICKRQNMSAVQEEIFNRICQLIGDTDVTEVNIPDCLKDAWDNDDLTILNLFNFILDQQCVLKNSIDAVGTEGLTVDSLITIYNPCPTNCQCEDIPTVTIKLKDALNDMITCLCNARAQIKDLEAEKKIKFISGFDLFNYPKQLSKLDIDLIVAPLQNNVFNQCKSNIKFTEIIIYCHFLWIIAILPNLLLGYRLIASIICNISFFKLKVIAVSVFWH
jgi:hypothetical protein